MLLSPKTTSCFRAFKKTIGPSCLVEAAKGYAKEDRYLRRTLNSGTMRPRISLRVG